MKNLKITNKTILMTIDVPVELPYLTTTAECQLIIWKDKKGEILVNADDWNLDEFTFMGVKQLTDHKTWNNFVADQAKYGLTIREDIQAEVDQYFDAETKKELVKISKFQDNENSRQSSNTGSNRHDHPSAGINRKCNTRDTR